MGRVWHGRELFDEDWPLSPDTPIASLRERLEHGPGVALLRGFPLDRFEPWCATLGTPVSQDAAGHRLLEVRDHGYAPGDPRFRGPYSRRALSFHTDRCDVIAFACVRPAAEGGANQILCSEALRDRIAADDPVALGELEGSFAYRRHTVDPGNPRPYTLVPVFTEHDGHFAASFLRVLIDRADRDPALPSLTEAQRHALDTLERHAADPGLHATFRLQAGDVLLLNNWTTMHRRTAFVDDPSSPRLLHRVWLSMPDSRPLDPRFREHFGATEAGALRGGIWPAEQAS